MRKLPRRTGSVPVVIVVPQPRALVTASSPGTLLTDRTPVELR
ncbi:hypothetical protein ACFY3N_19835 [Streptomyces sp. NPDC000348]